jgi:segregation and condensation protein B
MPDDVEQQAETSTETPEDVTSPALSIEETRASIEALLYVSGGPLSLRELKKAIPEAGDQIKPALLELVEIYAREGRGLQIVEVAGGWQITTRPELHECVGRLFDTPKPARLSIQALETLAVIAYRQPITVPEIMELRGVRSASVVRNLLEKKLIKIVGRKNVVGRPLLYGTTKEFLLRFGLKGIKDLPQLKDMSEIFGEEVASQLEVLEALDAGSAVQQEPDSDSSSDDVSETGEPESET